METQKNTRGKGIGKGYYKRNNTFYADITTDKGRRRVSLKTNNEKTAKAYYAKLIADEGKRHYLETKTYNYTFKDLADKYLKDTESVLKSHKKVKSFVRTLLNFFGEEKKINTFTISDIDSLKTDVLGRSGNTNFNRLFMTLKIMLKKAVEWEILDRGILDAIKNRKPLKENQRTDYLQADEVNKLLNAAKGGIKNILTALIYTGCRKSEILNLEWTQVDLKTGLITLKGEDTKSGKGRIIPIAPELLKILKAMNKKERYAFINPKTKKPYYDIKRSFKKALKDAGLKTDWHIHDLRHTFASHLANLGNSEIYDIQQLLGHADPRTTSRYIGLIRAARLKKQIDALKFGTNLAQTEKTGN